MTATALTFSMRPADFPWALGLILFAPGSHGLRGLESSLGGHPIQGFRGVGDMVMLFTALAVGMLVAAACIRPGEPA